MNNSDLINGCIEIIAAGFTAMNIVRLYKDKFISGVSPYATAFFTLWGMWNIYFYPKNGLWFSFIGGLLIVLCNASWIGLLIFYKKFSKSTKNF